MLRCTIFFKLPRDSHCQGPKGFDAKMILGDAMTAKAADACYVQCRRLVSVFSLEHISNLVALQPDSGV